MPNPKLAPIYTPRFPLWYPQFFLFTEAYVPFSFIISTHT